MNEFDSIALDVLNNEINRLESSSDKQKRTLKTATRRLDVLIGRVKAIYDQYLSTNPRPKVIFSSDWCDEFQKSNEWKIYNILDCHARALSEDIEDFEADYDDACWDLTVLINIRRQIEDRIKKEEEKIMEDREYNEEYDIPDEFFAVEEDD